jgi:type III secretion protein W
MKRDAFRTQFNYESIGNLFFDAAEERYPTAEKLNQLVSRLTDPVILDPIENTFAKITLLNSIRNMIKSVSPRIYRSLQHRDDLYMAVIEALEDLEDELEELEEKSLEEEEEEVN